MTNGVFRIGYRVYYPFVSECARLPKLRIKDGCSMPGMLVEMIKLIADRLNLRVEATDFTDLYSNKDELHRAFANNSFDMLAATFETSTELEKRFEFSIPLYYSTTTLAVQRPHKLLDNTDFFKIYDSYVWLGLLLSFSVFCVFGCIFWLVERWLKVSNNVLIGDLIWQLVRLQAMQYQKVEYKLTSSNLLVFIFALLQCGLLVKMYSNVITSCTIQKPNARPFDINNLIDVLKDGRYSFVFDWREDEVYTEIQQSSRSPFYELRQVFKTNPAQFAHTTSRKNEGKIPKDLEPLELVDRHSLVTVFQDDMEDAFQADEFCSLVYMESNFPVKPKSFMFPKGHHLSPKINELILTDYVYFVQIYNKYIGGYRRPSKCFKDNNKPNSLELNSYRGQIYLFTVGLLVGIIVFVIEFFVH